MCWVISIISITLIILTLSDSTFLQKVLTISPSLELQQTLSDKQPSKGSFSDVLYSNWLQLKYTYDHNVSNNSLLALSGVQKVAYIKSMLRQYSHSFQVSRINQSLVVLEINEFVNHTRGDGGSSFLVTSQSTSLQACSYRDNFRGKYTVYCQFHGNCTFITIKLTYIQFLAFTGNDLNLAKLFPLLQTLWERRICLYTNHSTTTEQNMEILLCNSSYLKYKIHDQPPYGYWYLRDKPVKWISQGCILSPIINRQAACLCLKSKYKTIYALGASHLRNIAYYFMELCQNLPYSGKLGNAKTHNNLKVSNIHFKWLNYANNLSEFFNNISQDTSTVHHNDVILFQTGAWDLAYSGFDNFSKIIVPELISAVSDFLKSNSTWKQARLMWYNIIAYPDMSSQGRMFRNNHIIAALNWNMTENFRKLGVEIIDTFSLTFPWSVGHVCNMHYFCRESATNYIGALGKPFVYDSFFRLCRKFT